MNGNLLLLLLKLVLMPHHQFLSCIQWLAFPSKHTPTIATRMTPHPPNF